MRPNAWMKCVAVLLLALGAQRTLSASGRADVRKLDAQPAWVVEGLGTTSDAAIENALDAAYTRAKQYLDEQRPAITWPLTREYVRDNMVKSPNEKDSAVQQFLQDKDWKPAPPIPVPGKDVCGLCLQRKSDDDTKTIYRVLLRVEIPLEKIKAEEIKHQTALRLERARERQLILVRMLAGIVAVLIAVASYLRLEDATKGYYTTLLRVVAVAFVALVVAGLALIGT